MWVYLQGFANSFRAPIQFGCPPNTEMIRFPLSVEPGSMSSVVVQKKCAKTKAPCALAAAAD